MYIPYLSRFLFFSCQIDHAELWVSIHDIRIHPFDRWFYFDLCDTITSCPSATEFHVNVAQATQDDENIIYKIICIYTYLLYNILYFIYTHVSAKQ